MQVITKGKDVFYTFASYKDFFNYSTSKECKRTQHFNEEKKDCMSSNKDFFKHDNYAAYLASVKNIAKNENKNKRKLVPGMSGGSVNVPAYLSGSPINMFNVANAKRNGVSAIKKRYVINTANNWKVKQSDITEFLNKLLDEINKDIALGNRFEIIVKAHSQNIDTKSNVYTTINIKGLNEPFNANVLNVVFDSDFHRRAFFRLIEQDINVFNKLEKTASIAIPNTCSVLTPLGGISII